MLILLLLLLALCVAVLFYITLNHNYWQKKNVPTVEPKWFFGNYKDILLSHRHLGLVFQDIYKAFPSAPFVGYLKIRQPGVLLRDPALIRTVLASDFSSFANNDINVDKDVDFLFGNNPFVLKGEEWKRARGHFTPTVTTTRLKTYFPAILAICEYLTSHVKRHIGENGLVEFETKQLSITYTTDVVANAVFGVESDSFNNPDNVFVKISSNLFGGSFADHLKFMSVLLFPQLASVLKLRFVTKECETAMMSLTRKVIQHREATGETRNDFFQHMIQYKQNDSLGVFTDKYIAAHCFGFMADGTVTSSDALCFTLFELAWHEDVQERLRSEILDKLKETGGDITFEAISELKYLDMVLSESLRMHPPAMAIHRITTKQHTLPGNVVISEGTPVTVPVYALHTDPQHYPQPDKFDPDRFTPEAVAARDKFTYIPFGEGPRICLGMKFAQLQVKAGVVALLSKFRLRPSPRSSYPLAVDPKILTKRPLNGAWVYFQQI